MKNRIFLVEMILILSINFFLSIQFPLTQINFTGMLHNHPFPVIIWSCCSVLLLHQLIFLSEKLHIKRNVSIIYSIALEIVCIATLLFPYSPENMPLSSSLHLIFAGIFFFGITFFYLYILFQFSLRLPAKTAKIGNFYLTVCFLCGLIYMGYYSINGLFEVVYTSGLAISVYALIHQVI